MGIASGSVHPSTRRKVKHRRSVTHSAVLAYNKLPLSTKLVSKKMTFRREIKRYVTKCNSMYIPNYDKIELTQHIERKMTTQDVSYNIDEHGSLIRNIIPYKSYI